MVNHIIIRILITSISAENIRHCQSTISYGYYIWIICDYDSSPQIFCFQKQRHCGAAHWPIRFSFHFRVGPNYIFLQTQRRCGAFQQLIRLRTCFRVEPKFCYTEALLSSPEANRIHFWFSSTRACNPNRSSSEFPRWVSRWFEQIMFRWGSDETIFEISDFLLANWFVEFWNF